MQISKRNNKTQAGFSMIELMLALVVIGLLSIPIYYIYKEASAGAKTENEVTNISGMAATIRKAWKSSSDFTGLTEAAMITRKQVPDKLVSGTALMNSWSGAVTIGPSDISGGGGTSAFMITYNLVPVGSCMDIVAGVAGAFSTVIVEATTIKSPTTSFNQAAMATACSPAAENVEIKMIGM